MSEMLSFFLLLDGLKSNGNSNDRKFIYLIELMKSENSRKIAPKQKVPTRYVVKRYTCAQFPATP